MKNLFAFTIAFIACAFFSQITHAQSEENRTKMQLTVNYGGKTITADLNAVSTSLSRGYDELTPTTIGKDSAKIELPKSTPGSFYLTIDVKKINDDLLTVFAKKKNKFDGTITIVDTYGKNATRTIKFKQASLYSYSDQFSAVSYGESYGASAISFMCKEVSVNGIAIEQ